MAANMWKNSLNNVGSYNNKILYETLHHFFDSETVFTFWISLVSQISNSYKFWDRGSYLREYFRAKEYKSKALI